VPDVASAIEYVQKLAAAYGDTQLTMNLLDADGDNPIFFLALNEAVIKPNNR
jgi:hypothetical protein